MLLSTIDCCMPKVAAISGISVFRDSFFVLKGTLGGVVVASVKSANEGGGGGGGSGGGGGGGQACTNNAFSAFSARCKASCSSASISFRRSSRISVCELFSSSSNLSCNKLISKLCLFLSSSRVLFKSSISARSRKQSVLPSGLRPSKRMVL